MMLVKVATAIGAFVVNSFNTPAKWIAGAAGMLWAAIDPAIPFIALCTLFVFIDCVSAWMLSRRVQRYHPEQAKGSKFRSEYASEIFNTLAIIYLLVIGGYWLDEAVFTMMAVNLGNWIAGAFCLIQIISILENCSSCNGSTWAMVVQKVLVDKTKRHLDIDIEKIIKTLPSPPVEGGRKDTETSGEKKRKRPTPNPSRKKGGKKDTGTSGEKKPRPRKKKENKENIEDYDA